MFAQDCPDGHKCLPWANDGSSVWNATTCNPVDPSPAAVGEPCLVEGNAYSGVDDCEAGAMCWSVDASGEGVCVALCEASPDQPQCSGQTTCALGNDTLVALCLPPCDPMAQDCPDADEACYPIGDVFVCSRVDPAPAEPGDPCERVGGCEPGSLCWLGDTASESFGEESGPGPGTCLPLCPWMDPDANATCTALDPTLTCQPWYPPGNVLPPYDTIGACLP